MQPVWESVRAVAAEEAMRSFLPGYFEGPADAARHIIGTAELRRRAGVAVAWTVVNGNEWLGEARGHGRDLTAMDNANNAIGLAIGARAQSYDEVVSMAREAIGQGLANGGTGEAGSPVWLSPQRWREPRGRTDVSPIGSIEWRQREPGGGAYAFGNREHGFLRGLASREAEARRLADLDAVPPEAWSADDVRAVIRSRPYRNSADPARTKWHQRVRAFFDAQRAAEDGSANESDGSKSAAGGGARSSGGIVNVSAYVRNGGDGPVQVSAHQRSAPG